MSRLLAQPVRISTPQIGIDGRGVISGARDPVVTDGRIGDFWLNTVSKILYGPKTAAATLSAIWPNKGLIRGAPGWYPVSSFVTDGVRRVTAIDWSGGEGTKPAIGYVGAGGIVSNIEDAVDVRGPQGPQALISGLDAAATVITDASLIATGEAEADNEKRPAVQVFDIGTTLPRKSIAHAASSTVSKEVRTVLANGYASSADRGTGPYNRAAAQPAHPGKFRSQDRWTPAGDSDSASGGWWEYSDRQVHADAFGMKADDSSDDTAAFLRAAAVAVAQKKALILPYGTIRCDQIALTECGKSVV